jgi:Holliday junction resolvase YEN1
MDGSLSEGSFTRSGILRIHQAKLGPGGPSTHANVNGYVVKIAAYRLIQDTIAKLDNRSRNLALEAPENECSFWIPAVVLMSVLPKLVQRFHSQAKEKKKTAVPSPVYRMVGLFLK